MPAYLHPDVHDLGLAEIRDHAERVVAVTGTPADYAAVAAATIVEAALTPTDFTIGPGDVSGRKISSAAKTATATATGDVAHVCLVDDTGSRLLYRATETKAETITAGNPVQIPELVYESRDPA